MKIKCPVKRCGKIFNHDGELKHHFVSDHSMDDVVETLVSKTFKIHEKIEGYETKCKDKNFSNYMVMELKSLLEDEK